MPRSPLSEIQLAILRALSEFEPPFTLTGGAALVGAYLQHRTTRDLDLFWRDREELENLVRQVGDVLEEEGMTVETLQSERSFHRFQVTQDQESCVVDLVAEPFPALAEPELRQVEGVLVRVDSAPELLAAKLTTLVSRSELRDLIDVQALLESGEDLECGLKDAARKDAGFSPLILAWTLRNFRILILGKAIGASDESLAELRAFRDDLVERLLGHHEDEQDEQGERE